VAGGGNVTRWGPSCPRYLRWIHAALLIVLIMLAMLAGTAAFMPGAVFAQYENSVVAAAEYRPKAKAAVNGAEAANTVQRTTRYRACGTQSYWWLCNSVSNAVCSGAGGGTWHCWTVITERHRLNVFHFRCRNVYVYVNRLGTPTTPARHYC
jgi:hypothetical protein